MWTKKDEEELTAVYQRHTELSEKRKFEAAEFAAQIGEVVYTGTGGALRLDSLFSAKDRVFQVFLKHCELPVEQKGVQSFPVTEPTEEQLQLAAESFFGEEESIAGRHTKVAKMWLDIWKAILAK